MVVEAPDDDLQNLDIFPKIRKLGETGASEGDR